MELVLGTSFILGFITGICINGIVKLARQIVF